MIVAHRSSSDCNARGPTCYVLPVLWMTSWFYIMGWIVRQAAAQVGCQMLFGRVRHMASAGAKSALSDGIVFVHFTCGRGSVFLWTAVRYCISSYVDDVIFPHNGAMGQNQRQVMFGEFFARRRYSWCNCYIARSLFKLFYCQEIHNQTRKTEPCYVRAFSN